MLPVTACIMHVEVSWTMKKVWLYLALQERLCNGELHPR